MWVFLEIHTHSLYILTIPLLLSMAPEHPKSFTFIENTIFCHLLEDSNQQEYFQILKKDVW